MAGHPHIVLIGLRGSGKSSVGRLVAARLGRPFVDLDDLTPVLAGYSSVRRAWAAVGEQGFRRAESVALRLVINLVDGPWVIALGGGTPTAPGAAELLRQAQLDGRIVVFYLRATAAELRRRMESVDNAHRPPLTSASSALDEVEAMLGGREGLYRMIAGDTIETGERSLRGVADRITELCRER